jgi:hypothetical protein
MLNAAAVSPIQPKPLKLDIPFMEIFAAYDWKPFQSCLFNACFARISRCGSRAIFVYY